MDFKTIEDGIIAELKAKVAYLKTVETYAGQIDREMDGMPVRFPAAYVSYGGSRFSPGDAGRPNHREAAGFSVFVCARDLGGQDKARKDTQGAYDMVKDVLDALTNNGLGLGIDPLVPVRAALLYSGRETAVYEVEFSAEFERG